jgi:hypothetical protein
LSDVTTWKRDRRLSSPRSLPSTAPTSFAFGSGKLLNEIREESQETAQPHVQRTSAWIGTRYRDIQAKGKDESRSDLKPVRPGGFSSTFGTALAVDPPSAEACCSPSKTYIPLGLADDDFEFAARTIKNDPLGAS